MSSKFIFVYNENDKVQDPEIGIFADLNIEESVKFIPVYKQYKSRIKRFLIKLIFSRKLNKFFNNPLKKFFYIFDKFNISKTESIYFIIPTMSLIKIDISYLQEIKDKNKNYKIVLLLLDSLSAYSTHLKYLNNKIYDKIWDLVLTFDKNDAQKYKFHYLGYSYYSSFHKIKASNHISDIHYIGWLKGNRENLIGSIYDACLKNNLVPNINIVAEHIQKIKNSSLSTISNFIDYSVVIADIKSTNCILEVLQDGQKAQSIRYFEAVVYNKKLLSNNPNLKDLPFYNARYMKYFEKLDDIDWNWVSKKERLTIKSQDIN